MTKKKKPNSIRSKILWTVAMALIGVLMVASVQRKMNADVASTVVAIKPIKGDNNLINKKEVMAFFTEYLGYDLESAEVKDLDLREMEEMLNEDQRIKVSQIFIDGQNRLNIWIIQRQPIVRVMDGVRTSYYLDEDGRKLAIGRNNAIRVPVATGDIELYKEDFLTAKRKSRLREVFEVATHIQNDKNLRPLIEQIDVEDEQIVLIPKIGRHELTLGDSKNLEDKFENLKVMYRDGLSRVGWRRYSVLKLDFKGQVTGVKRK